MKNKILKKLTAATIMFTALLSLVACKKETADFKTEDQLLQETMISFHQTYTKLAETLDLKETLQSRLSFNSPYDTTYTISQHAYSYFWQNSYPGGGTFYDVYFKKNAGEQFITIYIADGTTPYIKITNNQIEIAKLDGENKYYYDSDNKISLTEETAKQYKIMTPEMIEDCYKNIKQAKFMYYKGYVINTETGTWTKDSASSYRSDTVSYYKSYNDYLFDEAYASYNSLNAVFYDHCKFLDDETKYNETFYKFKTIYNDGENIIPTEILLED